MRTQVLWLGIGLMASGVASILSCSSADSTATNVVPVSDAAVDKSIQDVAADKSVEASSPESGAESATVETGDGPQSGDAETGAQDTGAEAEAGCLSAILCGSEGTCCPLATECVEGACVAPCPGSQIRCAATCCAASDVCVLGTCATPTTPCSDSVDCAPTEFCEPSLKKCVAQPPGATTCEYVKPVNTFSPTLLWSWPKSTVLPEYDQAISGALIADMDKDGTPDVVVAAATRAGAVSSTLGGHVFILDGKTGIDKWPATVAAFLPENEIEFSSEMALADLTGDGTIEVVARGKTGQVIAFNADGSVAWKSTKGDGGTYLYPHPYSSVSIADMDGDGKGEIVLGGMVLGSDGKIRAGVGHELVSKVPTYGTNSIVADIDGDGVQEVVGGNIVYRLDDTPLWDINTIADGYPALADFEGDGTPELVVTGSGFGVRVMNAKTGGVLAVMAGLDGSPGAPVIADFDGDGTREIGVQWGAVCKYVVYEFDQTLGLKERWTANLGAQCTGLFASTAFDFNGDGKVEVFTHNDCFVFALDGTTGNELWKIPASHGSWSEFVSVADVDGDGSAEIIFPSNDEIFLKTGTWQCAYGGAGMTHGYYVYHDANHSWMPTRRIWNQQSYHISNIRVDGTLPLHEPQSWGPGGYNNYRVSAQGKGASNAADLTASLAASLLQCPKSILLQATVRNDGAIGAPEGIAVSFYQTTPSVTYLGTVLTTKPLPPGGTEVVTWTAIPPNPSADFRVVVDSDKDSKGAINECNETNNEATVQKVRCDSTIK